MANEQNQQQQKKPIIGLQNLPFQVIETKGGKQKVSFKYEDKHYIGWVEEKQREGFTGSTWTERYGYFRICDWNICTVCFPKDNQYNNNDSFII